MNREVKEMMEKKTNTKTAWKNKTLLLINHQTHELNRGLGSKREKVSFVNAPFSWNAKGVHTPCMKYKYCLAQYEYYYLTRAWGHFNPVRTAVPFSSQICPVRKWLRIHAGHFLLFVFSLIVCFSFFLFFIFLSRSYTIYSIFILATGKHALRKNGKKLPNLKSVLVAVHHTSK